MCSHVPNKGEQMARYCGYYSNASRGKRKKAGAYDKIPGILLSKFNDFRKTGGRSTIDIMLVIGHIH